MASKQPVRRRGDSVATIWFNSALLTAGAWREMHRELTEKKLLDDVARNFHRAGAHKVAARREMHDRIHVAV